MFRRLAVAILLVLVAPAVVRATGADQPLTVSLDGRTVPVSEIPRHHCHDLDYPIIRCFDTKEERDASLAASALQPSAGATSLPFVTMYEDITYGGWSYTASTNFTSLGSIGWNDRVSSFIGLNGYYGTFYRDNSYQGPSYRFLPNQHVGYVGDGWNDQFSSVARG